MSKVERYRILFKGIVQGVGFRPYLYKTATSHNLTGFVKNTSEGVILEVEGAGIQDFITYTFANLPPLSKVVAHEIIPIDVQHSSHFEIHASESTSKSDLLVSPDIAICENCKRELMDPEDRRYRYPFINCTDCGPRLTIIQDLPYDRPLTTMSVFAMCPDCQKEYRDPLDRRYHAQPVSCYRCGPTLALYDLHQPDLKIEGGGDIIGEVCRQLKAGKLAAIKGLGGYHLACLAGSDEAVAEMRRRKRRERKPFALMGTMEMIREHCVISEDEEKHLSAPSAPILLLKRKSIAHGNQSKSISTHVAPGQNTIGFMLPYTPLHILLLQGVGAPLVMTSANFSDEPIIHKDGAPGLTRLADVILTNDREIHLFADDSVARVLAGRMYMIRRSRGYVPYPITMPFKPESTILGLGPMLKTTFTFWRGDKAISSPYIGTTDTPESIRVQRFGLRHYMKLFAFEPEIVAIDKHPSYPNRLLAREFKQAEIVEIQHHKAHVGSLMAETGFTGPMIGIAFDGTGYGDDGKIWGGEFFTGDYRKLDRFGHLKYLFLPAGDKSIKEPWRFSLSLLYALYGESAETISFAERFAKRGQQQLQVIKNQLGGVETSSSGRIFDAAACLLGIGESNYFDGDLPSQLQSIAEECESIEGLYPFSIGNENGAAILNLLPMFDEMLKDRAELPEKAYRFHATLAAAIAAMAEKAREHTGARTVGLTGGVFQNTLLLRLTLAQLRRKEFDILLHSMVPSNDGGISLGQALLAGSI